MILGGFGLGADLEIGCEGSCAGWDVVVYHVEATAFHPTFAGEGGGLDGGIGSSSRAGRGRHVRVLWVRDEKEARRGREENIGRVKEPY